MWQYSDGGGSLDHDVFNGTLDQLKALSSVTQRACCSSYSNLLQPTAAPSSPGHGLHAGRGGVTRCDGRFTLAMHYWQPRPL